MIRFNAQLVTLDASADETQPSRTITGLAVPWDVVANLSGDVGPVKFLKGSISIDGPMPKLLEFHDDTRVIGRVTERVASDEGLMFSATLSKSRAADDAMALLADGSISAVSIGAVPLKFKRVNGVMEVSEARMIELSLVSFPAYADAEIQSVYASAEDKEEMPKEETPPQPSEEDDIMSEPTTVEAAIATQPIYATLKKEVKIPTAVEYLAAAISGGDKWKAFHEVLKAAAPDVDLASGPGTLPEILVQPVYNNFQGLRPVVDAVGVRSMPAAGSTFIRPKVTTHNSMGVQATDLATLTASTMVVSSETVTKGTYGGYVSISEQLLDWSEPSMLTVLLDDMARIYANTTDNVAADALVAGATTTGAFGDPTVPADWLAWIGASSTTILTASNGNNPNTLFCSADVFGDLIALSDSSGRPLFPNLNAQNAMGAVAVTSDVGTAFGCRVVRDRNFAANTLILGDASGFEIFESQKGAISVDVPSTLSRTIAFRGYFATLMIDLNKFVAASLY
jgi:HK97 family phage prohead protease